MADTRPNRIIPNAYQSPNFYVDDLLPLLSGEEWKCMSFLIRKTLGWQKTSDRLAKSVIARATGLSISTVDKCMANLISFGLALRLAENNGSHDGVEYGVQMEDEKIIWSALEERKNAINTRNIKRTEAARKAAKITQSVAQTRSVPQKETGDVGHPPTRSVGQGTQKPIKSTENERFSAIAQKLENLGSGALNSMAVDYINEWLPKHSDEWIDAAIEEARKRKISRGSVKYVDSILVGWEANGYPKPRAERVQSAKRQGTDFYKALGVSQNG